MSIEERIQEAINNGEVLSILYHGGSQPGALREVSPIQLKDGKIRARCYSSNAVKTFIVNKVELVDGSYKTTKPEWDSNKTLSPIYESLEGFVKEHERELSELGWYVFIQNDEVGLHRPTKTKVPRPLKTPTIWMAYDECTYDSVLGFDGEIHKENIRKRTRPWSIRSDYKATRTFGSLDKAVPVFMEWAKELSPKK